MVVLWLCRSAQDSLQADDRRHHSNKTPPPKSRKWLVATIATSEWWRRLLNPLLAIKREERDVSASASEKRHLEDGVYVEAIGFYRLRRLKK